MKTHHSSFLVNAIFRECTVLHETAIRQSSLFKIIFVSSLRFERDTEDRGTTSVLAAKNYSSRRIIVILVTEQFEADGKSSFAEKLFHPRLILRLKCRIAVMPQIRP